MNSQNSTLSLWKEIATIISLIAVPIILAVGGWVIQDKISEQGTRNQYVQIAIGILSNNPPEKPSAEQLELRKWAASIIDLYSPIKFTKEGQEALLREKIGVSDPIAWEDFVEGNCGAFIITHNEHAYSECMARRHQESEEKLRKLEEQSNYVVDQNSSNSIGKTKKIGIYLHDLLDSQCICCNI